MEFRELKGLATPKNLDEAIEHALMFGPCNQLQERTYHVLKDFMAQKFGVAYLEIGQWRDGKLEKDPEKILEELFERLSGRKP